jgi:hypothetical protein
MVGRPSPAESRTKSILFAHFLTRVIDGDRDLSAVVMECLAVEFRSVWAATVGTSVGILSRFVE